MHASFWLQALAGIDVEDTMTETLSIAGSSIAYDVSGKGPLVVLAHGMGDSRHSYRFVAPALVAAGYRVANVDIRGCGDSSLGWDGYSRTDIAGDLVAVVRHLGGPAVIIGHSISGGAATIAAATAPDLIAGVVELAPFTRKQSVSPARAAPGAGATGPARPSSATVLLLGSLSAWKKYLDLAYPTKPADWDRRAGPDRGQDERARPDEGPAGHVQERTDRRRRAAARRHLPGPGRPGQPRPRLGRPPRRGREDHRRPAAPASASWP